MSINLKFNKSALVCLALTGLAWGIASSVHAAPNFPITAEHRKLAQASQDGIDQKWLASDAPQIYTVKSGDTLWKISGLFLKSAWRWPALWGLNTDEIKNPHLIYPGEVLNLVFENGKAKLKRAGMSNQVVRLSPSIRIDEQLSNPIATIPYSSIAPFLTRPVMVNDEQFDNSGRVFATKDDQLNVGTGGFVYAKDLSDDVVIGQMVSIYRPGRMIQDPEAIGSEKEKKPLGVEAVFLGEAKLVRKTKNGVATLEIMNASQEIGKDDRVLLLPKEYIFNFAPRSPADNIEARIVMMHDGRTGSLLVNEKRQSREYETEGGKLSLIVLNKGEDNGLEPGHVLNLKRPSKVIAERSSLGYSDGRKVKDAIEIPSEEYGSAMVFKTFSNMSYAIVMQASTSVIAGDSAVTPGQEDSD